jgi:hypothetical protein
MRKLKLAILLPLVALLMVPTSVHAVAQPSIVDCGIAFDRTYCLQVYNIAICNMNITPNSQTGKCNDTQGSPIPCCSGPMILAENGSLWFNQNPLPGDNIYLNWYFLVYNDSWASYLGNCPCSTGPISVNTEWQYVSIAGAFTNQPATTCPSPTGCNYNLIFHADLSGLGGRDSPYHTDIWTLFTIPYTR